MRLQVIRNLDAPTGTSNQSSCLSFDNARITSNLHNIGFKLGTNANELVVSANVLKHVEIDKLKVSPKTIPKIVFDHSDDEDADAIHDGQLLTHLVGEISEVGLDEAMLGSLDDLTPISQKSKSHSSKKNKKIPPKRARISKSLKGSR